MLVGKIIDLYNSEREKIFYSVVFLYFCFLGFFSFEIYEGNKNDDSYLLYMGIVQLIFSIVTPLISALAIDGTQNYAGNFCIFAWVSDIIFMMTYNIYYFGFVINILVDKVCIIINTIYIILSLIGFICAVWDY